MHVPRILAPVLFWGLMGSLLTGEVRRTPADCATRPCVYNVTCASAQCTRDESSELQAVFEEMQGGDTVYLGAGSMWTGNFEIKAGRGPEEWITVAADSAGRLTPDGIRVTPSHSPHMAKLRTPNFVAALRLQSGPTPPRLIHFIGLEIFPGPGVFATNADLIRVDENTARVPEELPWGIDFDRCYIHGVGESETRNGMLANGRHLTVRNSYFSNIRMTGIESHAIVSYNSPGPFTIYNNYIEAASIGVLFGGAEPSLRGAFLPSDLDMRFNYFTKAPVWFSRSPDYKGKQFVIKNLLEWKIGARHSVRLNVFDYNFKDSSTDQSGQAIAINIRRPRDGTGSWARTEDIEFTENVVRRSFGTWSMLGADGPPNDRALLRNITVRNNLFHHIGNEWHFNDGRDDISTFGRIISGGENIRVEKNTFHTSGEQTVDRSRLGSALQLEIQEVPMRDFSYRENILAGGWYPFKASGHPIGGGTFNLASGKVNVTHNLIAGMEQQSFDSCRSDQNGERVCKPNILISNAAWDANAVGWVNPAQFDFRLAESSPYRTASATQQPIGADIAALPLIRNLELKPGPASLVMTWELSAPIQDLECVLEISPDQSLQSKAGAWVPVADLDPALFAGADIASRAGNLAIGPKRIFVAGTDARDATFLGNTQHRGLAPATLHYYRLQCAGDTRSGTFRTLALPETPARDVTYQVVPPRGLAFDHVIVVYGEKETGAPYNYAGQTVPSSCAAEGCAFQIRDVSHRPQYVQAWFRDRDGNVLEGLPPEVIP